LRTVANNGVTQYTPAYQEKFMIRRNLKISLIKIKVNQVKTTTLAIECCFFFYQSMVFVTQEKIFRKGWQPFRKAESVSGYSFFF
jgi:hypothetical protein